MSRPTPKPGEVVEVDSIPDCDFCQMWLGTQRPGPYDFKSRLGPWAHGCLFHYEALKAAPSLGVGKAQLWILREPTA